MCGVRPCKQVCQLSALQMACPKRLSTVPGFSESYFISLVGSIALKKYCIDFLYCLRGFYFWNLFK